jgi:hypothetical protein
MGPQGISVGIPAQVAVGGRHGWVLVPGLVPAQDISAAQVQLFRIYPTPQEVASGQRTERTAPFLPTRLAWA